MLEADSGSSGSRDESDEVGATLTGVHKVSAVYSSKYQKLITTLKIKGKNIDFEDLMNSYTDTQYERSFTFYAPITLNVWL